MTSRTGVAVNQNRPAEPKLRLVEQENGWTKVALTLDDQDISRAFIIPMSLRYGVATIRMDGIGDVATDESHRHQGHSRRVMEAAVARMREGPAAVSTLYGISDFYPKFGYATLGPESSIQLRDLDELKEHPGGWRARQAQADDLPAIRTLYDRCTAEATAALIRAETGVAWGRLCQGVERGDDECCVVGDDDGALVAYAWQAKGCWWMSHWERWSPGGLKIAEAFALTPPAADALLDSCGVWARELRQDRIELAIPPDGHVALAAMLRTSLACQHSSRDGEFMGRVVGAESLLRSIQPELARLWGAASNHFRGRLLIDTGEERVALAFVDGEVTIAGTAPADSSVMTASISPGDLARLVFGGMPPAEYLARLSGVDGAAAEMLVALFPRRFPYIYPADRF
ncbi:MAG: GNAT family N-acetyltransferase [Chloroflexia bacterium]|nr:GNAT family N-acetyltransferase [Chloroflexia bacterium]MBA3643493.1 GNAT family N-acetyltransferase [Chloroflexia bacterium]